MEFFYVVSQGNSSRVRKPTQDLNDRDEQVWYNRILEVDYKHLKEPDEISILDCLINPHVKGNCAWPRRWRCERFQTENDGPIEVYTQDGRNRGQQPTVSGTAYCWNDACIQNSNNVNNAM